MNFIQHSQFNWQHSKKGSWKLMFSSSLYFDIKKRAWIVND